MSSDRRTGALSNLTVLAFPFGGAALTRKGSLNHAKSSRSRRLPRVTDRRLREGMLQRPRGKEILMQSLPHCTFLAALAFLLLAVVPALAQPPARTHVGANASDLVTLVTETSPTEAGVIAPLSFALRADGSATPFAIPADAVLVVTDVTVTMPRNNAPAGATSPRSATLRASIARFRSRS
jgi:hypothetical protein